ncbi:MAG: aldehyde dehydrogenase family protein [Thermoplasmatales archaeon]|nr:aldehyde dehydrogenase family protein [Thermoplasmatales archaeon]
MNVKKGAIIPTGGKRWEESPGNYYLPAVLSDVKSGMPVCDEETFGPVAILIGQR